MPFLSVKMYSCILGFHLLVWCPKWTPASSSCLIEIIDIWMSSFGFSTTEAVRHNPCSHWQRHRFRFLHLCVYYFISLCFAQPLELYHIAFFYAISFVNVYNLFTIFLAKNTARNTALNKITQNIFRAADFNAFSCVPFPHSMTFPVPWASRVSYPRLYILSYSTV